MKSLLLLFVSCVLGIALFSQTQVPPGPISGTWTLAGSPYLIEGINTIEDGTTLTIEAGVTLKWQNDSCPMWVYGQIIAIGTDSEYIRFTSEDPEGSMGSIRFNAPLSGNDSSHFHYCVFDNGNVFGDTPDNSGGALAILDFDKVRIDYCTFFNNTALDNLIDPNPSGGAIALRNSSPIIKHSTFTGNISISAGAILCYMESNPDIVSNSFSSNEAVDVGVWGTGYGGAISCYMLSDPKIIDNTFTDNTAGTGGGAIACVDQCDPLIKRNLIYENNCDWIGGAIELQDSSNAFIINNTIANNTADEGGGIDLWTNCKPEISNTILWGNKADVAGPQMYIQDYESSPSFYYCDVEGSDTSFGGVAFTGTYEHCIDEDPLFVDPLLGDYHLNAGSPCINAGDPTMFDPDGTRCDIGALFYDMTGYTSFEDNASNPEIQCYPNPADESSNIRYQISDIRNITLAIYDITGKQLSLVVNESKPAGEYTHRFDTSVLPDGMYFIRLQTEKGSAVSKLLVVH